MIIFTLSGSHTHAGGASTSLCATMLLPTIRLRSIAQIATAVAVTASILHRAFGFPCKRAVFTPALASSGNYARWLALVAMTRFAVELHTEGGNPGWLAL